jgi:FHS family L-fucose permease-like MFS transporter
MTGAVATRTGNFHTAMAIPTAFYVLAWVFPVYVNVWKGDVLDAHRNTDLNVTETNMVHTEGGEKGVQEQRIEVVEAK